MKYLFFIFYSLTIFASEDSYSFKVTDHFITTQSEDKTANTSEKLFMNEAKIQGSYNDWNGGIQFSNRMDLERESQKSDYFKLEKKLIALENENWDIKVGDSHQEYGKGIALSLYEDTAYGIDNTLEGMSVKNTGDFGYIQLMGGRVNSLRSPVAINPASDPLYDKDVYLVGTSTCLGYSQTGKFGGHFLFSKDQDPGNKEYTQEQKTYGLFISQESILDTIDFYAEGNLIDTKSLQISKENTHGYGSYSSLTYAIDSWKVKIEGKDYRDYQFGFQKPPTLEEDIVTKNNFEDVSGGRFTLEKRFTDSGITSSLSYLNAYDRELSTQIHHPVMGLKVSLTNKSEWSGKIGYRNALNEENAYHYNTKLKIHTGKGEALELEYKKQFWNRQINTASKTEENRNEFLIGYTFNESLSLLTGYEYIPSRAESEGQHYFNVGGSYKTSSLNIRAFVGQTSGGTQCSGGVCRTVPAYTGAYLDTTYYF